MRDPVRGVPVTVLEGFAPLSRAELPKWLAGLAREPAVASGQNGAFVAILSFGGTLS
jgi:hypothetical protein